MRASFILTLYIVFACSRSALCQTEKSTWKEYRSAADGFALRVPSLPTTHDSPALPGATVYAIPLKEAGSGVVLRVKKNVADCNGVVSRLKDGIKSRTNSDADPSSVKEVSIEGHAGVEFRWAKNATYTNLDRWYCVDGRLYIFSVNWPTAESFPVEATIILD